MARLLMSRYEQYRRGWADGERDWCEGTRTLYLRKALPSSDFVSVADVLRGFQLEFSIAVIIDVARGTYYHKGYDDAVRRYCYAEYGLGMPEMIERAVARLIQERLAEVEQRRTARETRAERSRSTSGDN
jgi:hypothetical protein